MPLHKATEHKSCVHVDVSTGVGGRAPDGHDENLSPAHGVCGWQMCQSVACPEQTQSGDKFLNIY